MKNLKKLIAMMLMILSVFFFACNKDEDNELSPDKAKVTLSEMDDQMTADMDDMLNSEGFKAMQVLTSMEEPFAMGKSNTRTSVLTNIEKYLIPFNTSVKTKSAYNVTEFVFDEYKGTYIWDNDSVKWDIVLGGDKIIVKFPSDSNNLDVNDATITINNYEEQLFVDGDNENYQPTAISANLYIGSLKLVEITFNAVWATSGDPESLDISVYLNPFTFSGDLAVTSSSGEVNFSILLNTNQIFSTGLSVTLRDPYTMITLEDTTELNIKNVSGYIQYREIKISADLNVYNTAEILNNFFAGTSTYTTIDELVDAVNDEIDAKITSNGDLVANIKLGKINNKPTIVLKFSDGSVEAAEPYFNDFESNISEFFDLLDIYFGGDGE